MQTTITFSQGRSFLFLWILLSAASGLVQAAQLPSGFSETRIAQNLNPTGMAIAPDGRVFLLEKNGRILIVKNDQLLATPFLTLSNVDDFNERGLLGLAFDPNFTANGYVYVYYTVKGTPTFNRVSRFASSGDVAVAGSEFVLLNLESLNAGNHNGGALNFGSDGKLYIATGDAAVSSNGQNLNTTFGKILRINSDGTIPTDNPFYSSGTGNNRAIYAYGLRNPFSFAVQPGTGRIFVNDVGNSAFEEINNIVAGKNYGWSAIEGFRTTQTPPANYQDPLYAYGRSSGCSIIGAAFYNPGTAMFPSNYVGKFFFGDYCNGYIKVLNPANGQVESTFATGINRPVDIEVAGNGVLYYLARAGQGGGSTGDNTSSNNGSLWKVVYTGSTAPSISQQPASLTVSVGSNATFSVSASGSQPLLYQWQRNTTNIAGATQSTYTLNNAQTADNGAKFRCVVTNASGSATSNEATLTVSANRPPVVTISTPTSNSLYRAGGILNFSGTVTDPEEGSLPASAFTWWIDFHHDAHTHPALTATSGTRSGTYEVPRVGEISDNVWYRIYLRATDSQGASNTSYVDVFPQKVVLTLESEPSGASLNLDGSTAPSPRTVNSVVGITRNLEASATFVSGGTTYTFRQWSDGNTSRTRVFDTPATNATYRAVYEQTTALRDPENPANVVSGLNYEYYEGVWSAVPSFGGLTAVKTGNVPLFDLSPRNRNDNFAFRFTGYVDIPADGTYTFYTSSDDGSQLFIGSQAVVNNDGLHSIQERTGSIGLKAGRHSFTVTFFEREGSETLNVSYSSASLSKRLIPASALYRTGSSGPVSLQLEAETAVRSGVQASTLHAGYTGTGFGDYINSSGDYIEWTANVPATGSYTLGFRYALGASTGRPLEIRVNGIVAQASMAFPTTGSWTNWQIASLPVTLNSGVNTIRATAIGSSGANVDHLLVSTATIVAAQRTFASDSPVRSSQLLLYPVPATDVLQVRLTSDRTEQAELRVVDRLGRLMHKATVTLVAGENELVLNTRDMSPDVYILTITSTTRQRQTGMFTKF